MEATATGPVQKSLVVPLPVEKAFRLFTDGISSWWPFETHSIGGAEVEFAAFDPAARRVYERTADGREHEWAAIAVWAPPHRFVLDWRVNPERPGTEVEVRFATEGAATRVDLEHRGWEQAGPDERASYDGGWDYVLGRYATAAG